jgi:AraC-like DNA-binding protein
MMCAYSPIGPLRAMYRPLVCLILQGTKQMTVGREEHEFTAGQTLIIGVDLPVIGRVVRATPDEPYLAIAVELDMAIMQSLALEMDVTSVPETATSLFVENLDETILSCATRLLRLIDRPEADRVLRPSILRELHYWLLSSRHGPALRRLIVPDGHARRIADAIDLVRRRYREAIPIEQLAEASHLSPSAFRRHFKTVTSLSPIQFQKQLRLIDARRLMLNEGLTAARAGAAVGYESPSQFSREYARMFGVPPRRHQRVNEIGSSKPRVDLDKVASPALDMLVEATRGKPS